MKRYSGLLLFLLLTLSAATMVAGCTQPSPSPQRGTSTATPVVNDTTRLGVGIQLFDQSKFHMFEYKVYRSNGQITLYAGDFKSEYDTAAYANQSNVRHMRQTQTYGAGSQASIAVIDLYYSPVNNLVLGGHRNLTVAGVTQQADIGFDQREYRDLDMSAISSNVKFLDQGTEVVTVPKGIFPDAKKYTSVDSGITMWMSARAPVPVKMAGTASANGTTVTTTMELVDYA